jgi:hypothetical protein
MTDINKLIDEARSFVAWNRADNIAGETDGLLNELCDALEEAQSKLDKIRFLIPLGVAKHDEMYDALMSINKAFWDNA